MTTKEYKIVLAGEFGSGKTTFASRSVSGKEGKAKIAALKSETFPVTLYTSAGTVVFKLYDTTLHAKGGLPNEDFFRTADACILFYDTTKESSFNGLTQWYDAFLAANKRKGTDDLPVIVVGSKVDDIKGRDVKPKDNDFARKRNLPYREISSKANYGIKELYLEVAKTLLGDGVQLTDELELVKADVEVDEAALEKLMKEYEDAGKL